MSDAELVVLGLVNEGAQYAYEVEQRIVQRRLRDWTSVAFSSLYYLLHRAEKAGLASSKPGPGQRGPSTRRYRLTAKGRKEVVQAVLARLQAGASPAGVQLAVMFAGAVSPVEFRRAVADYAQQCRQAAAQARMQWQYLPESPYRVFQDAIFDHSITRLETEAAWAERFAQRLEQARGST
jgi:DNA-binding PadR family transcriptional regulator